MRVFGSRVLDNAPASKRSHSAVRFSGVRQMTPAFMVSRAAATSSRHRVPLSMSAADIHGLAVGTTRGSHCLMASAALLLRGPDQLMKTLLASAILAVPFKLSLLQETYRLRYAEVNAKASSKTILVRKNASLKVKA